MNLFEYFLFFWLGMTLVKLVIAITTMLVAITEYRIKHGFRIGFIGLLSGLITTSISFGSYIFVMWPFVLYNEGLTFFEFPDKIIKELSLERLRFIDEGADI